MYTFMGKMAWAGGSMNKASLTGGLKEVKGVSEEQEGMRIIVRPLLQ